jgi:hypothetical protein
MVRYDLGEFADILTGYCDEQDQRVKPLIETLIARIDSALSTLGAYIDDPAVQEAVSRAREARDTASNILYGWLGDYTRSGRNLADELRNA